MLCKYEAASYVRAAEDRNDLHAWEASWRAKTHEFDESVAGSACHLERSESEFASVENRTQSSMKTKTEERVSGHIRRSINLNKIAPPNMRQHFDRLHTAEATSDEIEEYCEAMEEFNKDAKEPLGFASPVVGKGVPYNFGEGGTKGKGNMH